MRLFSRYWQSCVKENIGTANKFFFKQNKNAPVFQVLKMKIPGVRFYEKIK